MTSNEMIELRARYPNGLVISLSLSTSTEYSTLLTQLKEKGKLSSKPSKVLIFGIPPRSIQAQDNTPLSSILRSGNTIIVEGNVNKRARSQSQKSRGRGKVLNSGQKRGRVATIADLKPKKSTKSVDIDYDDPNDVDWTVDADSEDEITKNRSTTKQNRRTRGASSIRGASSNRGGRRKRNDKELLSADYLKEAEGILGMALAKAVGEGSDGKNNKANKSLRATAQIALNERFAQADGERRCQAVLSDRYEIIIGSNNLTFKVKYRELDRKKWIEEGEFEVFPKNVLSAVIKSVGEGFDENGKSEMHNLQMLEMAIKSPRLFWNLVKIYGKEYEEGLRELAPELNWSILASRHRSLSEKAKRNLENDQSENISD